MPSSSQRVARAAIAQLRSTKDKHSNLINIAKCAGWAKRDGADMLFLPECLGFMGDSAEHTLNEADPPINHQQQQQEQQQEEHCEIITPPRTTLFRRTLADTIARCAKGGPGCHDDVDVDDDKMPSISNAVLDDDESKITSIIEELRFIACEAKLWISGGGVHTIVPPSDLNDTTATKSLTPSADSGGDRSKIYNTHVIIDSDGRITAYYHKIHLFDVSIPGKVNLRESNTTAPGKRLVVCDSPVGKLGLTICYDMRFSEMYVDLVQKMDAQVLLMPSAFTVPTGQAHWHTLLRDRAIESQCYVLAAAQVGQHNEKRESYGHSIVYNPWGDKMADAGGYDGAGSSGTIDKSQNDISPVRVPSIIIEWINFVSTMDGVDSFLTTAMRWQCVRITNKYKASRRKWWFGAAGDCEGVQGTSLGGTRCSVRHSPKVGTAAVVVELGFNEEQWGDSHALPSRRA
ncbi:hypothetical protein ACHAXR_009508 [Thalassiosira sp. AJA248-18]